MFKKFILIALLSGCSVSGAIRTWSSAGSTDANNGSNYSPTSNIIPTDSLLLDGTSIVNWTMTDSLSVATIKMDPTYTGNWSMGGKKLTTATSLYLNGLTGSWTMNAAYLMTGDGWFYIGNFGSFSGAGCHVTLDGMIDTLSFTKSLGTRSNYFRGFSMCKAVGSRAYVLHTANAVATHNITIGMGYMTRNGSGFMGIDPDTAYPFTMGRSGYNWTSNTFNGGLAIWRTDTSIKTIRLGYLRIGGSISFPIISSFNDTVIFEDSATSPGFR